MRMLSGLHNKDARGIWLFLRDLKLLDFVLILLGIGLTVALTASAYQGATGTAIIRIESIDGVREYDLSKEQVLYIPGPMGKSIVQIKDGAASFVDSPCRDKLCVHAGHLDHDGQWTACMPNRVFVTIRGQASGKNDASDTADVQSW